MAELTQAQIKKLRGMAQTLDATVQLGKNGLTDAFYDGLNRALTTAELVKLKFVAFKEEKKDLAPQIAARTSSTLVARVGNVAVYYRPHPDPAKRRVLPETDSSNLDE